MIVGSPKHSIHHCRTHCVPHRSKSWPTPGPDSRKGRVRAPSGLVETTQRDSNWSPTGFFSLSECEHQVVSLADAASGRLSFVHCFQDVSRLKSSLQVQLREETVAKPEEAPIQKSTCVLFFLGSLGHEGSAVFPPRMHFFLTKCQHSRWSQLAKHR